MMFGAVLAASMTAAPAAAQVQLEANGARAQQRWGGELGLGYSLRLGGFRLTPLGGVFIHRGDNDRYYRDTFSNGQSRCRDSTNGQFADDGDCVNLAAKWYGKLEATYAIPAGPEIGAGARFSGDRTRPYGTIAFPIGPSARIKGNVGDRYYALGVNFGF